MIWFRVAELWQETWNRPHTLSLKIIEEEINYGNLMHTDTEEHRALCYGDIVYFRIESEREGVENVLGK